MEKETILLIAAAIAFAFALLAVLKSKWLDFASLRQAEYEGYAARNPGRPIPNAELSHRARQKLSRRKFVVSIAKLVIPALALAAAFAELSSKEREEDNASQSP